MVILSRAKEPAVRATERERGSGVRFVEANIRRLFFECPFARCTTSFGLRNRMSRIHRYRDSSLALSSPANAGSARAAQNDSLEDKLGHYLPRNQ